MINELKELQALTGWGILAVKELLSKAGNVTDAKKLFLENQKPFQDYARDFGHAKKRPDKGGWWIADFVNRVPSGVIASVDPILRDWVRARQEFDKKFDEIANASFPQHIEELIKTVRVQQTYGVAEESFQELAWTFAIKTHIVPRFEPDWLQLLTQDPFDKLRILTNTSAAQSELERCAVFSMPNKADLSVYLSQSLRQAEQYLIAARSVEYTVRPLLLFYGATNLARAILTPRLANLKNQYGAHGLEGTTNTTVQTIADYFVTPTARQGLFHALDQGLPGNHSIEPQAGPWSLLDLCRLIPELADTLDAYESRGSKCSMILDYDYHIANYGNLPYYNHLGMVFRRSYITKCGLNPSDPDFALKVRAAFPSDFWVLGTEPDNPPLKAGFAPEFQEEMYAYLHKVENRIWRRRVYPLLHQGGLDGKFYLVYNDGKPRPHQFLILYALLYGLSMLVRYKPVEWSLILTSNGLSRALIEQVLRIAALKLPILATEELLGRRILGSMDNLPK